MNAAPEPSTAQDSPGEPPSLAVASVRAAMERHGLPKYRQSAWLADAKKKFASSAEPNTFAGLAPATR